MMNGIPCPERPKELSIKTENLKELKGSLIRLLNATGSTQNGGNAVTKGHGQKRQKSALKNIKKERTMYQPVQEMLNQRTQRRQALMEAIHKRKRTILKKDPTPSSLRNKGLSLQNCLLKLTKQKHSAYTSSTYWL